MAEPHGEERSRSYLYVFIALAIFTALEVGVSYLEDLPEALRLGALVALAISKVALVVLWFMHLRYDRRVFAVPFVLGLVLVVPLVLIVAITLDDKNGAVGSPQTSVSDNAAMSDTSSAGTSSNQGSNGGNDQTTSGAANTASTLDVTQSDSGLELSTTTLGAGDVQIHVTNQSQEARQLSIVRPGASLSGLLPWHGVTEDRLFAMVHTGDEVPPSEATDMTVTMEPGRYVLISGPPQHTVGNTYAVVQVTGTASSTATGTQAQPESSDESALNGDQLVDTRCTSCHSRERIDTADKSHDEWAETVDRMIGYGAQLNDEEREAVISYLAEAH